jgi:parallel beta-helix repeat protein
MKRITILWIFLVILLHTTAQTNYFVDAGTGNDNNNGTSLGTAWKTIQKACNTASPNSVVQIKGGIYHENLVMNVSGTASNPITFKNYNAEQVLIDGTGTSGTCMLTITNKNYLNIQNLILQNKTVKDAQGILVETTGSATSTGLTFSNITIKSINWTNNALTLPTANDNAQGFIAYGRNGGITNLTIEGAQIINNILGYSEALSLDGNISGFIIKNCYIHDNTNIGIAAIGNYKTSTVPATDHARNGSITGNTCYKNVSLYATSGGIYIDGGKSITVEKNICYENGNGIELGCEENGTADSITVKNNLIYNNQQVGIYVGGYTTQTTGQVLNSIIRNNTLFQNNYSKDGTGEVALSKASNCIFENNIFYTNSENTLMSVDDITPQTGNVFNYNCWFTPSGNASDITVNWKKNTYTTFATYKTGTSQETSSIFKNPMLTAASLPAPDLHLDPNSPCINTGNPSSVIGNGETDYTGNPRKTGVIDMGAYELLSTGIFATDRSTSSFCYPNPFIVETTLFSSVDLKNATLKIYNLHGQEISEEKEISGQQISIRRSALIRGVYLYRIVQGNEIVTTGMLHIE